MASTLDLLRKLSAQKVDYVLVGGMAAIAHGASTVTEDVDVCIQFELPTLEPLFRALNGTNPRQRMNPTRPALGTETVRRKQEPVPRHRRWGSRSLGRDRRGRLDDLIRCKRALARQKDVRAANELELVRQSLSKK